MNNNYWYLYGIAGASNAYRIVRYEYVDPNFCSSEDIKRHASYLKAYNADVEHVYAITNRPGLGKLVMNTIMRNTIAGNVAFKDVLERSGIMII